MSDDEEENINQNTQSPQCIVHVDFIGQRVNLLCKLSPNLDCVGASLNFNHSILSITTSRILYKQNNNGASLVVTNNENIPIAQPVATIGNVPSVNSYENNHNKFNERFQIVSNLKSFLTMEKEHDPNNNGEKLSPRMPSITSHSSSEERIVLYESYFIEVKTKASKQNKSPQTLFKKTELPHSIQFIHSNRMKNGKNYFLFLSSSSIQIFSFTVDAKTGSMKGPPKESKTLFSKSLPDGDTSTSFTSIFSGIGNKSPQTNEDHEMIWYQWDGDTHFLYFIVRSSLNANFSLGKTNLILYSWHIDMEELQQIYKYPILNHLPPDLIHFGSKYFPVSKTIDPFADAHFKINTLTPSFFNSFFLEASTIRMQIIKLENNSDILCMQYKDLRPSLQTNLLNVYIYHFRERKCLKINLQSKFYLLIGKYKRDNLILLLPSKYLQLIKGSTLSTIFQFNKNQFNLSLHNEIPVKLDEPHLVPVFGHIEGHFMNLKNGCIFSFDLMIPYLTSSHWLQIPDLVNDQFIPVLEFLLLHYSKDISLQFLSYLFYSMEKSPHKKNIHFTKLISLGMKEYMIGACYQKATIKGMDIDFISLLPSSRHNFYESVLGVTSSIIKKKQLNNMGSVAMDSPRTPPPSNSAIASPQQQSLIFTNASYEEYLRLAIIFFNKSGKNWNHKKWASDFHALLLDEMELLFETIMSQKNEEEKYFFKLMECFFTSLILDFRLPSPVEFSLNFVLSGFKALERDVFYQYCDKGVFEINNQIINALCDSELLSKENHDDVTCLNYLLRISTDPVNTSTVISYLENIEECQFAISNHFHECISSNMDDWDVDLNQNSLKKVLKKKQQKQEKKENREREHHSFIRDQILNIIGKHGSYSSSFSASFSNINGGGSLTQEYGSFIEDAKRTSEVDMDSEENNSEYSDVSALSVSATQTTFAPLVSYLLSIQKLSYSPVPSSDKSPLSAQDVLSRSSSGFGQPLTPGKEEEDAHMVAANPFNLYTKEREFIQSVATEQFLKRHFF
ncbi:hypothetical protein FDP41_002040 [Naegleria fowleri]|uniref:Gamma-secretase-activating protein C-terminal domain-containing protein n=1 Tax=Naegleria fowleri TaxID=5763 RepID=A0A6A5BZF9_NAEFO|nr:uncharacterized protein FDP41_002040 [Naegleria fowleri]KAF0978970.1 hypothetical protein FDP41_002040 [Naegleria fowleri]